MLGPGSCLVRCSRVLALRHFRAHLGRRRHADGRVRDRRRRRARPRPPRQRQRRHALNAAADAAPYRLLLPTQLPRRLQPRPLRHHAVRHVAASVAALPDNRTAVRSLGHNAARPWHTRGRGAVGAAACAALRGGGASGAGGGQSCAQAVRAGHGVQHTCHVAAVGHGGCGGAAGGAWGAGVAEGRQRQSACDTRKFVRLRP